MVGLKKSWNRFLNWLFPGRRASLLSEIMKSDQELGLYDEVTFPLKKEAFDKIPEMKISKYELNKDKKKDQNRIKIPSKNG